MAARNFASVKLKADLVDDARKEAELFNRSLGGQIEHWARLGRALEGAPGMPVERVRETLEGRVKLKDLTFVEQEAFLDQLHEWVKNPTAEEVAAYAALADLPGAVGLNENGKVVRTPLKPRLRKVS